MEEEGEDASLDSPDKVGKESTGKAAKKPKAAIADVAPIPAVPDAAPVSTSGKL